MKFIVSSLIFAGLAYAQVAFTNSDFSEIEAGTPFEITWAEATGPVTITLKTGPSDNLETVTTIASNQSGESFSWTPSATLSPGEQYALEITDGTDVNYSVQFTVGGGSAPSSSSAVSSVVSTSASSATVSSASSTASASAASSTSSPSPTPTTSDASSSATSSASIAESSSSVTSAASLTQSVTSADRTSATSTASETSVPGTNGAQGVVAPLVAPFLMAIGAALF